MNEELLAPCRACGQIVSKNLVEAEPHLTEEDERRRREEQEREVEERKK